MSNPWLLHVKEYRLKNPNVSYTEALKKAKQSYVKKEVKKSGPKELKIIQESPKPKKKKEKIPALEMAPEEYYELPKTKKKAEPKSKKVRIIVPAKKGAKKGAKKKAVKKSSGPTVKDMKASIREYKKEKCPSYSKKKKAELDKLIKQLKI